MTGVPSAAEAKKRRDSGIWQAVERADREVDNWSADALGLTQRFAVQHAHRPFLTEEVREWARLHGLPQPPDGRAWGAVMQRAARAGYIMQMGYAKARSSNLSPKVLWATTP
jgi:hypothetical protein